MAVLIDEDSSTEIGTGRRVLHTGVDDLVPGAVGALENVAHPRGLGPQPRHRRLVLKAIGCVFRIGYGDVGHDQFSSVLLYLKTLLCLSQFRAHAVNAMASNLQQTLI
jgi:hypothetical protein